MKLRNIAYALFIIATICLFTSCKKECKHQSIEWVIDKQATCTEEGIEHEECTKCHEKFDIKEIKKLKHICNDEGICTICGNEVATSGLIYKLNEDKKSYYVSEYIGIDIDIIIPAKYNGLYVTSIGDSVFSNFIGLTSIEIPNSVTCVDFCAFDDCDNISYNIYNNGKYLGNTENPYLVIVGVTNNTTESFSINPSIKLIGGGAFSKCESLKSIEIPDGVISIGVSAFNWCGSLKSIEIPDSVTSMGDEAFNMCKVITVYCEVLEKPSGWSERWNYSNYGNCNVIWGYKKE